VEVNERGQALHGGTGAYEHDYYRSEDPRLVKFPSWNLPSLSAGGTLTFFGDATIQPSRGAGSSASGGPGAQALSRRRALFAQEDDDSLSATILDEIKRFQTPLQYLPNASFGSRVRYALVPLNNGRVEIEPQGGISGRIGAGDAISRSNPREVYIVAITTERGLAAGALFGQGLERGLVRIGEELFFFEDPEPQAAPATGRLVPNSGATYNPPLGGAGATPVGPVAGDGRGEAFQDSFQLSGIQNGRFEPQGFVRIEDGSPERASFYETVFYRDLAGGQFGGLLRGRFHTPILSLETASQNRSRVVNVTKRVRLIGRALLGTQATVHELGDPVTLVPWVSVTPIVGPMTASGLPVLDSSGFSRRGGYVLVDSTQPGRPFEILPYLRTEGPNLLRVPRDERGELCLRGSFGTPYGPIGEGAFAWELPFRHYDRYAPETESESLAYFQRSFRAEGARWVSLSWRERPWRSGRERLADVVVAARFDREADWSAKPKNEPGSLYLFEKTKRARGGEDEPFVLDRVADELEIRIYFRYRPGAFQRVGGDVWNDDWKETPVLEELTIEYEKDGAIVRHEELPF
ncbi:MAG TPA: hypothetical protein VK116_12040, partial [Planctomycetota bacterium]|nr:hypothetical protein [Planctomycetota bacterium]